MAACLLFTVNGFGQFSFGVAPGLSTNSAYFGYKVGKIVPYVGFQYAGLNFKIKETGQEYDAGSNSLVPYTDETKVNGNLYVPNIGAKFFAVEQNKIKAYFNLSVAKPLLRGKVENNGEEYEDFGKTLKDINIIGGEFGFGVEYFFDDNFSIGGEFGLRYIGGKYSSSHTEQVYDPGTSSYVDSEVKENYNLGMNPTYSKISLNFYFNGKNE